MKFTVHEVITNGLNTGYVATYGSLPARSQSLTCNHRTKRKYKWKRIVSGVLNVCKKSTLM